MQKSLYNNFIEAFLSFYKKDKERYDVNTIVNNIISM